MALLSFCIAGAQTIHTQLNGRPLAQPPWQDVLVENDNCKEFGIDHVWIDMLLDTTITLFSPEVSRTDTFVYLSRNNENMQPSVEWFIEYGIHV